LAFQEDVEMRDAYNAGRCEAVVAARSDLDGLNRSPGINHLHSRAALDLGRDPFYAATPVGDNEWSDLVAGLIAGLLRRSD
jgi:ABC-type amino acid transport substrate-binding protein